METGTVLNELSIVTAVASPFTVAFAMFPKASFWKVLVAEGVVEDVRIPKFCWVFPDWVISRVVSVAAPISVIPVAGQGCRLRPGRHRGGNKPVSVVRGIVRIPAAGKPLLPRVTSRIGGSAQPLRVRIPHPELGLLPLCVSV